MSTDCYEHFNITLSMMIEENIVTKLLSLVNLAQYYNLFNTVNYFKKTGFTERGFQCACYVPAPLK